VPSTGVGKEADNPAKMIYLSGSCVPIASVHDKSIVVPDSLASKSVG